MYKTDKLNKILTPKERAVLEAAEKDALMLNISGDATLDVAVKPTRKKQTRQKKESIAYSDDASGAMNVSEAKPKRKRASKKKEASDLQNQNAS